jgi:hypothetical protein
MARIYHMRPIDLYRLTPLQLRMFQDDKPTPVF